MWISFDSFPIDKFAKLSPVPGSRSRGQRLTTKGERMIKYNNKKMKLPLGVTETDTALVTRTNPFSGRSIDLPKFAAVVYDKTIELNHLAEELDAATGQPPGISEHQKNWQIVRNGLSWFQQYFPKEYMVLLD